MFMKSLQEKYNLKPWTALSLKSFLYSLQSRSAVSPVQMSGLEDRNHLNAKESAEYSLSDDVFPIQQRNCISVDVLLWEVQPKVKIQQ